MKRDLLLLHQLLEMVRDPENHLRSLHEDLTAVGVEYAFVGGIALRPHNFSRMTTDIDVLISKKTAPNLKKLHGQGYTLRPGATNNMYLHVSNSRVMIDILIEGQVENGVILPNPLKVRQKINEVWYIKLSGLITLKLQAKRPQDIADVQRLIVANNLKRSYNKKLPQHLRDMFLDFLK